MAIRAAGRLRCTLSLARAFSTSNSSSSVFTDVCSSGLATLTRASSPSSSLEHLFGYGQLSGFDGRPCPPWRHLLVRCRSWTELRDCKHWLITLDFPKDPRPTREEMIDTYVKTLAAVLGSEEEAKKKIYALSTTVYTGFQCNIDEATSERLKEQPLVNWVLPDGYGDPELGIFAGDRYNNGVITPDPNPPRPPSERPRQRNYDRPRFDRERDFRATEGRDNMQGERRDYRPRPMEGRGNYRPMEGRDNYRPTEGRDNYRPTEGRDNYRPVEGRDNYRPMEGRDTMQGEQRDNRPPYERREPVQGERREYVRPEDQREPVPPSDRRDSF